MRGEGTRTYGNLCVYLKGISQIRTGGKSIPAFFFPFMLVISATAANVCARDEYMDQDVWSGSAGT